jgi:hypothetical protein
LTGILGEGVVPAVMRAVLDGRPSKFYKFQKTVLRNKLLFIGIGVLRLSVR